MRTAVASLVLALALGACTGLLFAPQRSLVLTPDRAGLAYRDVHFEAADGQPLHGWFLPAERKKGRGSACTVLFLHGNGENISTHIASVWWLPSEGYNVFLFDYRGYGRSPGEPTLPGVHRDAVAALDTVAGIDGVDPDRIVVFGQSLGGAIAIAALATSEHRHRIRALVTEGAVSSYRAIAREKLADYWLTWPLQAPLSLTISNEFKPLESIGRMAPTPVLIMHGLADKVVPPHHGRTLFEAAGEPKELWMLPGVGHIRGTVDRGVRADLAAYLAARCAARRRPSARRDP